jgi:hypothetical protein
MMPRTRQSQPFLNSLFPRVFALRAAHLREWLTTWVAAPVLSLVVVLVVIATLYTLMVLTSRR